MIYIIIKYFTQENGKRINGMSGAAARTGKVRKKRKETVYNK